MEKEILQSLRQEILEKSGLLPNNESGKSEGITQCFSASGPHYSF